MAESDALFDKNQLLFNLSVPLSALKMVRRPMPPQAIHIEKVDGKCASAPHPHGNRHHLYPYHPHQQHRHHHHHQLHQQQQDIGPDIAEPRQQLQQPFLLADSVTSEVFEQALNLAKLDFKQQKRGDNNVADESEHPTKNSKSSDTKLLTTKSTAAKCTTTTKATNTNTTSTNTYNKSTTQGVRVIERSSSAKVKNASVQVSRRNPNNLCQNARSPEPTPLSHLPVTTNSPPTRDTHDCTKQKFQRIHRDIANCLTDLQTLLSSFIKEGLNELTENEQEVGSSNQDLTIVKVVSRKLYSIKHQAQDLKKQVDHMPKNKGPPLGQQNKDMKYLSNRLASIFQGIQRVFHDMCRYLKKAPTYTLNPNMVFVCVVHLVHMLNVLSLLVGIWSEMAHISGKANDPHTVTGLHEMIVNTKLLCSQFQSENKSPPQANLFNQLDQRPNFITQFSKRPDNVKNKDKDRNKMKATTSRTISAKGKTSSKSGPPKSFPPKQTSVIYPSELQFHRKAFPTSSRQKPSVARRLDLHGSNTSSPRSNPMKLNTCSKRLTNSPEVPSAQQELFDQKHIRQMFYQLAQSSGKVDLPKSQTPESEVVNNEGAKDGDERPKQFLLQEPPPHSTQKTNGPTITNEDLNDYPSRKPAVQSGSSANGQASSLAKVQAGSLAKGQTGSLAKGQKGSLAKGQAGSSAKIEAGSLASDEEGAETSETLLQAFFRMSSIDKMIIRLQEIEEEQLKIRHTWSNLVYPATSLQKPPASTNGVQVGAEAQSRKETQGCQQRITSPKAITFTKVETKSTDQLNPAPSHHCCNVKITAGYTKACCSAADATPTAMPTSTQNRFFLQKHTLDAVKKNRAAYLLYLKKSAYHQVENFDPWELTEKMADAITTDCVTDVLAELQQLSDDIIQQIYEDEFASGTPSEI